MPAEADPQPKSHGWRVLAPIALAACGVLLVTSAQASGNAFRGTGISEMSDLVRAEDRRAEELAAEVSELSAQVDELAAASSVDSPGEAEALELLRAHAGMTPVRGPGLTVTLDDAPLPDDGTAEFDLDAYLVHQQDLEGVINALWAAGAEALMVQDQRIISTSSVKCIGPVLFLQGRVYPPPYTVTAIGDADAMLAALDESPSVTAYKAYVDWIGLGYATEVRDELVMPGYDGPRGVNVGTAT